MPNIYSTPYPKHLARAERRLYPKTEARSTSLIPFPEGIFPFSGPRPKEIEGSTLLSDLIDKLKRKLPGPETGVKAIREKPLGIRHP